MSEENNKKEDVPLNEESVDNAEETNARDVINTEGLSPHSIATILGNEILHRCHIPPELIRDLEQYMNSRFSSSIQTDQCYHEAVNTYFSNLSGNIGNMLVAAGTAKTCGKCSGVKIPAPYANFSYLSPKRKEDLFSSSIIYPILKNIVSQVEESAEPVLMKYLLKRIKEALAIAREQNPVILKAFLKRELEITNTKIEEELEFLTEESKEDL